VVEAPGFQALSRLLRDKRAYVKLTDAYRISSQHPSYADTHAFAHTLLAAAPDRILRGTDWPHVTRQWTVPMPCRPATRLDCRCGAANRVLADNPAALYGWR
jgi:2-pyrone-4,6-dicarboxylate lactonase